MNTSAIEQSAAFGLNVLPAIFGLQQEAFARLQKLTELNLAASKALLEEGQSTLSSLSTVPSGIPSSAGGMPQQFFARAQAYADQVRQIDSQFMAAATRAGTDLHQQCNAAFKQLGMINLEQTAPFGSNAVYSAMESVIGAMMRSSETMLGAKEPAAGARAPQRAA